MDSKKEQFQIPDPDGLNTSIRTALEYVASLVEKKVGTEHGCTALYWALHTTVMKHIAKE